MKLSRRTRTRLVVLNAAMWAVCAVIVLAVFGGPRGVVKEYVEPIDRELGGFAGVVLGTAGVGANTLPVYEIVVAPEKLRTAQLMRGEGAASDASPYSDTPWVQAQFRAGGPVLDVDLQLLSAADGARGLREQSWRVRFRGKQSFGGVHELTLRTGDTHAHARETVIRRIASDVGLLAPPSGLAALHVNGESAGIVFWSETESAEMLVRLGFADGEILMPRGKAPAAKSLLSNASDRAIALASYSPSIHREDEDGAPAVKLRRLLQLTQSASDEQFMREIEQLLDVDKTLQCNALAWVFGDPGDGFLRPWYFDPVTGLLEPVVTEFGSVASLAGLGAADDSPLIARLLQNDDYRARRNRALWQLVSHTGLDVEASSERHLGGLLTGVARSDGSLTRLGELRDYADFRRDARVALRERVASIRSALEAAEIETRTHPGLEAGTPTLTLELAPRGLAEILLTELRLEFGSALEAVQASAAMRLFDGDGAERRAARVLAEVVGSSITLRPEHFEVRTRVARSNDDSAWRVEIELPFVRREDWSRPGYLRQVEVAYRNAVTGDALPTARIASAQFAATIEETELRSALRPIAAVIADSGLPFELEGDELVLRAGIHLLEKTLVVPSAYRLRLEAGVTLRLAPDVSIISFRGVSARGTRQHPVRLRRADPNEAWGAFAVARAPEPSELSFVSISGGSRTSHAGIDFSAQLSFHASDFSLTDSEVRGAHKSDGVSAKRSSYVVTRTQFVSNRSDGFDSKWSQGAIRDSWFSNNGDDGLDLVDSIVSVSGCVFAGMGDKSISAGLRSHVAVADTRLVDSEVAIAAKADSRVDVRGSEFRGNRLGFSLYRGKPIFGGGLGTVTGGLFAQNILDFRVEPGSDLRLVDVNRDAVASDTDASVVYRTVFRTRPASFRLMDQSAARVQFNMLYTSRPVKGKSLY